MLGIILGDLLRRANLFAALHILLSNRISRVRRRIVGLFALIAAGKPPRPTDRKPGRKGGPPAP